MTNSPQNCSAATEHETRRNPEMEKFVQITPVVMEGYPDACNVWLKVENQKFMVSPHSCETRDEGEWLRDMLCIALARVVAESIPVAAQPTAKPDAWQIRRASGWMHVPDSLVDGYREAGEEVRPLYAAQPPAAPVETGHHVSCAPGGKPYADAHERCSADNAPTNRAIHDAIATSLQRNGLTHSGIQEAVQAVQNLYRAVPQPVGVREAVIEQCAKLVEPKRPRPCDCERCDCGNSGDLEAVAAWDADAANAKAIRALSLTRPESK